MVFVGLLLLALDLGWPWLRRIPFGRLPGDLNVVREGFSFHVPSSSCLLLSALVSVLWWLIRH